MALLAGVNYDPATAVSKATTAGLAMTALDTTNLRLSFTVPSNGAVLVRLHGVLHGAVAAPMVHLGVLEGSTVRLRMIDLGGLHSGSSPLATAQGGVNVLAVVPGLTPAANLTWDAAYGVEAAVASSGLKYGGPNNTTTNDAFGGFAFEIWDCQNLLGAQLYDPATLTSKSTSALLAMTALDTTNLRITFTAPASGNVLVRMRAVTSSATGVYPQILLGVLDGATVRGRSAPIGGAGNYQVLESLFLVTGLTPSSSYTWDAAYGVEITASTAVHFGGPNDATVNTAYGAFAYEIWAA